VRVGILGGTFNPPHLGHLICGQEAYVHLGLDRVTLIPARIPPHKEVPDEPGPEVRLELCRLAVAGDDRFTVSDMELAREGPSYTVDTLEALKSKAPDSEHFLILGGDIAAGLPEWREPGRILSLATLAVAERPGTDRGSIDRALAKVGDGGAEFFPMPPIGISSSDVRERVAAGRPIRYLVPDAVEQCIHAKHLYGLRTT
jgi:nicotinate-nucleotide adenylyltransferase